MSFNSLIGVCMHHVKIMIMPYYVDISFTYYDAILTVLLFLYNIKSICRNYLSKSS
jgi:hypothetical protein